MFEQMKADNIISTRGLKADAVHFNEMAVSYTHLDVYKRQVKQHLRLPKAASVQGKGHSPNT